MSLICENIVKTYGGKDVLQDVSLELKENKIYGLIGRNGAGKTTLLSILTAQNPATKGSVTLDGMPVWENRRALEKLCFSRELNVGAESGLASMKVKEYLRIAATYYDNWDHGMEKKLVELFELNVKKKLSKLSKGMLSMVTIIVALCSKAPYTLLDEPVAGLDVVAREQFYKLLLEEYSATGRTFVISTHIIEEAASVFERVIILDEGRIIEDAPTEELVSQFHYVSGREDVVDQVTRGLNVLSTQQLGRQKTVAVRGDPGKLQSAREADVDVVPMNLQKVFVALCGHEDLQAQ